MGDGITLTVNADTATAAENLSRFFGNLQASLDRVAVSGAGKNIGAGIEAGSKAASEGLSELRHTSMLTREAFHGLQATTLLLGGTHMPMLAEGIMAGRMALMTLRSAAQMTGIGIGTLAPVLGLVGVALAGGIAILRGYTTETQKAAKAQKELMDSMAKLPGLLGQVNELLKARRLSAEAANEYADYLTGKKKLYKNQAGETVTGPGPVIPPPSARVLMSGAMPMPDNANTREATLAEAQEYVKKQLEGKGGMGDPSIQAVTKLRELGREQRIESLQGLQREEAEIHAKYEKEREEIKKTLEEAKLSMTHKESQAGLDALGLSQKNEASAIQSARFKQQEERERHADEAFTKRKQELAQAAKADHEIFELKLNEAALKGSEKRSHGAEEEFKTRIKFYQGQYYAGEIGEQEYTKLTLEASIKRLQGLKEEAEEKIRTQKEEQQNKRKQFELQEELIQHDPYRSEIEKARELLPLLREQYDLTQKELATVQQQLAQPGLSDADRAKLTGQSLDLHKQQAGLGEQIQGAQDLSSIEGQMRRVMAEMRTAWGTLAMQIANAFKSAMQSATNSISSNLTSVIMRTKSWGQALYDIRTTILTGVIQSIIQMGVQWLTTHVFMEGVSIAYHALMRALAIETAATTTAANTATGTAGAVAGVGTAGAEGGWVGILIYLGVMAAAIAAVTAMFGGFAEGGYTGGGGRYEPAGIVHKGEYVFSAPAVKGIGLGRLDALHSGYASGGLVGGGQAGGPNIEVHVWGDQEKQMLRHIQSSQGVQHFIVDLVGKQAHKFR